MSTELDDTGTQNGKIRLGTGTIMKVRHSRVSRKEVRLWRESQKSVGEGGPQGLFVESLSVCGGNSKHKKEIRAGSRHIIPGL